MHVIETAPPPADLAKVNWTPTRAAGLERLADFAPHAGRNYARERNVDRGPDDRANVSGLSPWIRYRLITEEEVIAAILKFHNFAVAEKFIQEVFWRSYWKGWLEQRPDVLARFNAEQKALSGIWASDPALRRAVEGQTGLACFDAWVHELIEIGWLHNHARMWFASIWIFTLKLPWQLGADFFYQHLLDADPASNTLSWRWVAGLHTAGKHYLAHAANIRDNTCGRFYPLGDLNETALALREEAAMVPNRALPQGQALSGSPVALLLTDVDLHPESLAINAHVVGCAGLETVSVHAPGSPAARFRRGALADGLARAAAYLGCGAEALPAENIVPWARALGVRDVATAYAPTGLTAWALDDLEQRLAQEGIRLVRLLRPFDARVWPHASAGFFKMRERIPQLIAAPG